MEWTNSDHCGVISANIEIMLEKLESARKRNLERENRERLNEIFQELVEACRNLNIKPHGA